MKYLFLLLFAVTACSLTQENYMLPDTRETSTSTSTPAFNATNFYYNLLPAGSGVTVTGDIDDGSFYMENASVWSAAVIIDSAANWAYGEIFLSTDSYIKDLSSSVGGENAESGNLCAGVIFISSRTEYGVLFTGNNIDISSSATPANDDAYLTFLKPYSLSSYDFSVSNINI